MRFYKWHIFFALIVIAAAVFIFESVQKEIGGDLRVAFVADTYVNTQNFKVNGSELELLLRDADENGKRELYIESFHSDDAKERSKKLEELIKEDKWDLYIADKEALEGVENKGGFIEADYLPQKGAEVKTLTDEDGKVYAANLAGNSIIKRLGVYESENLYMAPAQGREKEASTFRKNGRNICYYILENREKYMF